MRILSFWLVQNLSYFLDASFCAEEGFSMRVFAESRSDSTGGNDKSVKKIMKAGFFKQQFTFNS